MPKVAPPLSTEPLPSEAVLRKIRIPFIHRASLAVGGIKEERFVIDLGMRGVFVDRADPLERGAEIEIWFTLPGNEIGIHARCRVAWWRPPSAAAASLSMPSGLGLEFVTMSDRDAERVRQYLVDYLRRHPRQRRFVRHPEEKDDDA
jgi:Tfp pilus assembly protein PilZ